MTTDARSDPNYQLLLPPPAVPSALPSPLSSSTNYTANPRKKRSKFAKFERHPGASSSAFPKRVPKPKYTRKPDPAAPNITMPCTECGRKFWSWKALFGHMRCHPDREWRGMKPPPHFRRAASPVNPVNQSWVSAMSDEDHEVAASLLMLGRANDPGGHLEVPCVTSNNPLAYRENESIDLNSGLGFRFACGGCNKVFGSHQALGGHRASHKNVKGCFAINKCGEGGETEHCDHCSGDGSGRENSVEDQTTFGVGAGLHKCGKCSRVFPSGQALGGHMRCHWDRAEDTSLPKPCGLDLNMPAPGEEESTSSYFSAFTLDLRLGL